MKIRQSLFAWLTGILLLGLILRVLALAHTLAPSVSAPTMDEMNYRELACSILDHQRYATWSEGFLTQSTRAPLYPLMIASSYLASGSRAFIVPKILNLVLDMLAILAVFILARKLFGIRAALCSSGLYAVLGHAVNYMLISSPHTLAVLLTLLIACSLTSLKDRYVPATLLLTLFYALLIHTRPVFMIALPFLIPAIYLQLSDFNRKTDTSEADGENHQSTASASSRPIRNFLAFARADYRSKCWKTLLPVFLIAMLCIPWEVRNYRIHKTVVPVCTIAGWHIASNGSFNMKLSLKFLTSHIYAPDHRAYSEGDFFALSRRMFFDSYLEHPFKLPFFGFIRLVRSWSPPLPWLRFFLPRAYVFPIQISNNAILPLPDFEGMIYLFIFANLAVFAFRRRFGKKVATAVARVFREFRGILILMAGYSLTHIIGIPLIAYRFIMEPLCLVFAVALMLEYWRIFREHRNSAKFAKGSDDAVSAPFVNINGGEITILAILALFFNLFLMLPAFHEPIPKHFNYSPPRHTPGYFSYNRIRDAQWNALGNVPEGAKMEVEGMVVYSRPGFKFIPTEYNPVRAEGFTSAKLRVEYATMRHPLGLGDVRLNFKLGDSPSNGAFLRLRGTVTTGPFKELMLNVYEIESLGDPEQLPNN